MNTSLSFKNPYIYIISLGFMLMTIGFPFPAYFEGRYLREADFLTREQSENITRRKEIFRSEWTQGKSVELEELDSDLLRLRKKALAVSALRGELNLRIALSQIMILIGTLLATLGSAFWFFDWKHERDRRQALTGGLSR